MRSRIRASRRAGLLAAALAAAVPAAAGAQGFGAIHGDPIPPEVDAVYVRGLQFLARTQAAAGNWDDRTGEGGAGVVGLSVLAMLAHGDDPVHGPWAAAISRGLGYILGAQRADNGYIGPSMYHHGFATLALAEAYGMVPDPRLGPALKKAADLILTSQALNPAHAWRYSPESRDADTTVSGAQFVALVAVRNAGISVPDRALLQALEFYQECQAADGNIGYTGNEGGGSSARNAIAVTVAALAREKESRFFKKTFRALVNGGEQDAGGYFFYYLYYAAQAYFHGDMQLWRAWNTRNLARLVESQGADGSWTGPNGRMFCTSAALLSLALNYRFLPIYER
jgi:hypothetical protein